MADDLATLGLRIQSDDVGTANQRLDTFTGSAGQAKRATDALTQSAAAASSQARQMAEAIAQQETVLRAQATTANAALTATKGNAAAVMALGQATAAQAAQARTAAQAQSNVTSILGIGSKAAKDAANSLGLTAFQMQQIAIQAPDVVQGLLSGQRPLQILIQQGGQVAQIMGMGPNGLGGVLSGLIKFLPGLLGFGAVAVVFGTLAKAWFDAQQDAADLNNALAATNNYAGLTAASFESMAKRVAAASDSGIGQARQTVLELVSTGQYSGQTLENVATYSEKFAQLTGADASKVASSFSSMKDDVTAFALQHAKSFHDLDQNQIDQIARLQALGKADQAALQYSKDLVDGIDKLKVAYTPLGEVLHDLKTKADDFWASLKGNFAPQNLEQQLATATATLRKFRADNALGGVEVDTPVGSYTAAPPGAKAESQQESAVADLVDQLAQQSFKASQAANAARNGDPLASQSQMAGLTAQVDQALAAQAQAQAGLTADVVKQAALQKQALVDQNAATRAQLAQQITDEQANTKYNDAQKAAAIGKLNQVAAITISTNAEHARLIDLQTEDALQKQAVAIADAHNDAASAILQAQLGITTSIKDRWTIETTLLNLADQKAIADAQSVIDSAKLGQATKAQADAAQAQIDAINNGHGYKQQVIDQEALAATIHQQAGIAQDTLQNQVDILQSRKGLAQYGFQQDTLDKEILAAEQQIAMSKAQETLAAAEATKDQVAIAKARADLAALEVVQTNQTKAAQDTFLQSYNKVSGSLDSMSSAFSRGDWVNASASLINAMGTAANALGMQGLSGLLGELGAIVPQVAAVMQFGASLGTAIGHATGGNVQNAKTGGMFGGVLGALIGSAIGDGGAARRKKEDQDAAATAQQLQQTELARQQTATQQRQQQEITLAGLTGNALQVTNLQRAQELDGLDASNKARQQEIYAITDELDALQKVIDARQADVDAANAAVTAAETALRAAYTAAQQALQAQIDAVTGAQDQLRSAYETQAQALQAQIDAVTGAQDQLRQAYQAQAADIQSTIDKFQSFSDSLGQFRQSLVQSTAASASPGAAYGVARSSLLGLQQQIASGDTSGLGNVQDIVNTFLQSSQANSATGGQYRSDQALAIQVVNQAKDLADQQVSAAQQQLNALTDQVAQLVDLNKGVVTVADAIDALNKAQSTADQAQAQLDALNKQVSQYIDLNNNVISVADAINALNAAQSTADQAQAQLNSLNAQISALQSLDKNIMDINGSVLAVGDAITNLQTALTKQATANQALADAQNAYQQAQQDAGKNTPAPGPALTTFTTPNYVYYVENNPDLKAQFQAQTGYARGRTEAAYGLQMWTNFDNSNRQYTPYGQMFAQGGAFINGIVSSPTAFNMGVMGEAGPEGILPLGMTATGQLGVHAIAANDNSGWMQVVDELQALRDEVSGFRRESSIGQGFLKNIRDLFVMVTRDGNAVLTEAA